jgi:hypothetical protein
MADSVRRSKLVNLILLIRRNTRTTGKRTTPLRLRPQFVSTKLLLYQ